MTVMANQSDQNVYIFISYEGEYLRLHDTISTARRVMN